MEIERSIDMSSNALKNMFRNGLEAMVGAVEKVVNGVSEIKGREVREKKMEERIEKEVRENKDS